MSTKSFKIVAGPSRDSLFDACKYAFDREINIPMRFTLANNVDITNIKVTSIEHEDGSGEKLILHGHCRISMGDEYESYSYSSFYDTKVRKGQLLITY